MITYVWLVGFPYDQCVKDVPGDKDESVYGGSRVIHYQVERPSHLFIVVILPVMRQYPNLSSAKKPCICASALKRVFRPSGNRSPDRKHGDPGVNWGSGSSGDGINFQGSHTALFKGQTHNIESIGPPSLQTCDLPEYTFKKWIFMEYEFEVNDKKPPHMCHSPDISII
jgi:hypothetical protein